MLHSGEPVLSFRPHPNHLSIAPLTEKGGRVFGVLLDGPPPVPDEWLMRMAKTAGPMIEMIWRREQVSPHPSLWVLLLLPVGAYAPPPSSREQLATVIKVAQAWVQDYANTPVRRMLWSSLIGRLAEQIRSDQMTPALPPAYLPLTRSRPTPPRRNNRRPSRLSTWRSTRSASAAPAPASPVEARAGAA